MVTFKKKNTVKKTVDQEFSYKAREPAKIKADTHYELCDTHMTAFGGLLALVKFLDLVNFKEVFERRYCSPKRKPELGCYHMIQGFLMLMFVGFTRLGHIEYIRRDPMICGIVGVGILPAISTFWRYLSSLCLNQFRAFLLISADSRQRVWQTCGLSYDSVCINIDTTVSTVYGAIEGSRKGHNTKHRGKKGLRPVFMFLEETREYLRGTQRQGSTMSDEELAKLIRDIHKYLPSCVRKVIVRGDAEFIGGLTIAACREKVDTRLYSPTRAANQFLPNKTGISGMSMGTMRHSMNQQAGRNRAGLLPCGFAKSSLVIGSWKFSLPMTTRIGYSQPI